MSPPDINQQEQKRRHRGPLIGIVFIVVLVLVGFVYWIAEELYFAPEPQESDDHISPAEIREGQVDVPASAPSKSVQPGDPDVKVAP